MTSMSADERRQRMVDILELPERGSLPVLDRITRIARRVFDVPSSAVTVFDADRAFLPGASGDLPASVPREHTFCQHVLETSTVITTSDATRDPRFRDLPAVRADPAIRFYLGYPLTEPGGTVIGAFCLFDTRARELDAAQVAEFSDLAAWAQRELLAEAESERARAAQTALLPDGPLRVGDWSVTGRCVAALNVGGDYFDYGADGDVLHAGLADVMGKGTAAALLGSSVHGALRAGIQSVTEGMDLGRYLQRAETRLASELDRSGAFVTAFQLSADTRTDRLRYADAGFGLALLLRATGERERLTGDDPPLGLRRQERREHRVEMLPGDRLVCVSDGVLDLLEDPVRWPEAIESIVRPSTDTEAIDTILDLATGRPPLDDVTVLIVHRHH